MRYLILIAMIFFTTCSFHRRNKQITCYAPKRMYSPTKYLLNCMVEGEDYDWVVKLDMKFIDEERATKYVRTLYKDAVIIELIHPWKIEGNVLGAEDITILGIRIKKTLRNKGYIR